jgi:hypothetical protein
MSRGLPHVKLWFKGALEGGAACTEMEKNRDAIKDVAILQVLVAKRFISLLLCESVLR